jgi:ATP-dependent DNA ligase
LSPPFVIVDGEIAALDEKGHSSFQLLQLFKKSGDVPVYYVFDLLQASYESHPAGDLRI